MLTRSLESGEDQPSARIIEIDSRYNIWLVVDGKYVASVDNEGKIRRWRVKDGMEPGTPVNAGSWVCDIAVSRDGKWIVGGTTGGLVQAWNVENGEKATKVNAYSDWMNAIADGLELPTTSTISGSESTKSRTKHKDVGNRGISTGEGWSQRQPPHQPDHSIWQGH